MYTFKILRLLYHWYKNFLIFSLLISPTFISSQEKRTIKIEWEKIIGASAYTLELQNEDQEIIFNQKTEETLLQVELEPGRYKKRLSVYNEKGEIETISDWLPLNVLEKPGVRVKIEWENIPIAKSYILEVRDLEGNIIKQKEAKENYAFIRLHPGDYEKRLLVVNQIGEIESESEWSPLHVILVLTPEIQKGQQTIKNSPDRQDILIRGNNFEEGIKVSLFFDGNEIPIKNTKVVDHRTLVVSLAVGNSPIGEYNLKLTSKRGKTTQAINYLKLEKASVKEQVKGTMENWEILLRSSVVPGWGQIYAGKEYDNSFDRWRGIIYSSLFFSTILYNYRLQLEFNKDVRKIEQFSIYGIAGMGIAPGSNGRFLAFASVVPPVLQANNHAMGLVKQNTTMNSLLIATYLIQVVDAYILNRNINYNFEKNNINASYERNNFLYGQEDRYSLNYTIRF